MNRDAWISKPTAAAILGISERWFDTQVRPRLPDEAIKTEGKALRFDGAAIVKFWIEYQKEKEPPPAPIDEDEALAGANTPEAEKLRRVKRYLAEHELALKRGEVVNKLDIGVWCLRLAEIDRSGWERAEKLGGKQIGEIGHETADEKSELIKREFFSDPGIDRPDADENGGGEQAKAPANDPPVR